MYQPTALSTSRSKFPHPFGASGVREFVTLVCLPQTGQIIVPLRESGYEGLNLFGRGISSLRTTSPAYPDISFIAGYPLLVDTTERNASFLGFLRSLCPPCLPVESRKSAFPLEVRVSGTPGIRTWYEIRRSSTTCSRRGTKKPAHVPAPRNSTYVSTCLCRRKTA